MTAAKRTFDVNVQRASYFLEIHKDKQKGAGAPTGPYRELPRGALVFAVGALDAYLSEASAEVLLVQAQAAAPSGELRDILRKVQVELPGLALELALLSTQAERMQRLRDCVVDHFQNHVSNHGAKAVAAAVGRFGGKVNDFWSALKKDGFADAAAELEKWTNVRHDIVHRGKKPAVRRPDAQQFIQLAQAVVQQLEKMA